MSVTETYEVDGIAVEKGTLHMMISDHLDWEDEAVHFPALQEKINAYAYFFTSGQYKDVYPDERIKRCSIEIYCMYEPSDKGREFFKTVGKQLKKSRIKIEWELSDDEEDDD